MNVYWQANTCLISDKNDKLCLSIEERLFPDLILLRLEGVVCMQTESIFIEELRAGVSIRRKVVLDLFGLRELSENACAAICSARRRLLTDCTDGLRIIGSPVQLFGYGAANAFLRSRAAQKGKGERDNV